MSQIFFPLVTIYNFLIQVRSTKKIVFSHIAYTEMWGN